jgi:hypothetical protein
MQKVLLALAVALAPALVRAEALYKWEDANGVVHYSNVAEIAPASAAVVETPITLEVDRIPGAEVAGEAEDAAFELEGGTVFTDEMLRGYAPPGYRFRPLPDAPRIYDEERLRFGCFTAGVLFYGGFSHADDISGVMNCFPYLLGPEAWLNTVRAELAMRQNGINPRDMIQLYGEYNARR